MAYIFIYSIYFGITKKIHRGQDKENDSDFR
jgi:hypothetical protein